MENKLSMGAVADYLRDRFGGTFDFRITTPALAVTPTKIVSNNFERVGLIMINLTGDVLCVSPSSRVSLTEGLKLSALNGILGFNLEQDLLLPALEWWGVSTGGGFAPWVLEVYRDTTGI